jgi:hypothetical protein
MAIKIHALLYLGLVLSFMSMASAISGTATYNTIYYREYLKINEVLYKINKCVGF